MPRTTIRGDTTDLLLRLQAALADRYLVERELGRGGMAVVFLAHDRKHDRAVALKVLRPELAAALGGERFLREIHLAARLQHPHILPLYDSGAADDILYYGMPYVEGESLRGWLDREQQLPLEDALRIARDVAEALAYAHSRGVVHRDIKPENILLSAGHVLVADFGIARALDAAAGEKLTETGLAIGTPSYMSPEQAGGSDRLDGRSDLYSLGCVLYEMLVGAPPFTGPTPQAILARHSLDPVPPPRTVRQAIPDGVEQAVLKALAKVPADRFATATQFAQALAAAGAGAATPRAAPRAPSRRRVLFGAAAALVVIGISAAAVLARNRPKVIPSASVIAVLPFASSVPDTALSRLGRDLVFTVSANLDGVGGIRTVDAHTVLAQSANPRATYSLEQGAALGRRFGAGSVVHGSLVRVGSDVRLDLGLFTSDSASPLARASATSSSGSIAALTDSVTWALLRQIWQHGEVPSPSLDVALKTHSVNALRAFLEGELALSEMRWDDAVRAYGRAIAADSGFWLAYARYAYADTWMNREDSMVVNASRRHRFDLPVRERLLIESQMVRYDSFPVSLARARELTERFPDH